MSNRKNRIILSDDDFEIKTKYYNFIIFYYCFHAVFLDNIILQKMFYFMRFDNLITLGPVQTSNFS